MAYITDKITSRSTGSKFADTAYEAHATRQLDGAMEGMSRYGATRGEAEQKINEAKWSDGTPVQIDANGIIDLTVTRNLDGQYQAFIADECDVDGVRSGFGKTPEDAKQDWHDMHDPVTALDKVQVLNRFSKQGDLKHLHRRFSNLSKDEKNRLIESLLSGDSPEDAFKHAKRLSRAVADAAAGMSLAVLLLVITFLSVLYGTPDGMGTDDVEHSDKFVSRSSARR